MKHPPSSSVTTTPNEAPVFSEIRYSLPDLLAELKLERSFGSFAMEKLNQAEIGKLFQSKKKPRGKKS